MLKAKVDRLVAKCDRLEAERIVDRVKLDEARAELDAYRAKLDTTQAELDEQRRGRLSMFVANALTDLARMIVSKCDFELKDDHSTKKLQQFAVNVKDNQLLKANVPPKHWGSLRKLDEVFTFSEIFMIY